MMVSPLHVRLSAPHPRYSKKNPLQADLVTISDCYSADQRSYSGEGLVGLSS